MKAKNKTFYISCPISVDIKVLEEVARKIKSKGFIAKYWERHTVYRESENLKECDYFVIIPPKNEWEKSTMEFPEGCRREILVARNEKKPILLAYRTRNDLFLYNTEITYNNKGISMISGIQKTGDSVFLSDSSGSMSSSSNIDKVSIPVETHIYRIEMVNKDYDRRLLLL